MVNTVSTAINGKTSSNQDTIANTTSLFNGALAFAATDIACKMPAPRKKPKPVARKKPRIITKKRKPVTQGKKTPAPTPAREPVIEQPQVQAPSPPAIAAPPVAPVPTPPPVVVAPPAPPVVVAPALIPAPVFPKMEITIGAGTNSSKGNIAEPNTLTTPLTTTTTTIINTPAPTALPPVILPPSATPEPRPHNNEGHIPGKRNHTNNHNGTSPETKKADYYRGSEGQSFGIKNKPNEDHHGVDAHMPKFTNQNSAADCDTPTQNTANTDHKGHKHMEHRAKDKDPQTRANNNENKNSNDNKDTTNTNNTTSDTQNPTSETTQTTTSQTTQPVTPPQPKITNIRRNSGSINIVAPVSLDGRTSIKGNIENGTFSTDQGGVTPFTQIGVGVDHKIPLGTSTDAVIGAEVGYVAGGSLGSGSFIKGSAEIQQKLTAPESLIGVKVLGGVAATASSTPIVSGDASLYIGAGADVKLNSTTSIGVTIKKHTNGETNFGGGVKFGF